jgi:hypothetical protein
MNSQRLMSSTKNINNLKPSDKLHILNVLNRAPCHDSIWGRSSIKHHIFLNSPTQGGGQLEDNNQSNTSARMDAVVGMI